MPCLGITRLNLDLLHLVNADFIASPVVESCCPARLVAGHLLRHFDPSPALEISGDPGCPKGVVADLCLDADICGSFADHPIRIHLGQRPTRQFPGVPIDGAKEQALGIFRQAGFVQVLVQVLVELVMTRQLVHLAALLPQTDPGATPLDVHVLDAHLNGGAHAREGENHQRDQGAIAQAESANRSRSIRGVPLLPDWREPGSSLF
jgi:hypothetical protein